MSALTSEGLVALHARMGRHFRRAEVRRRALRYLEGLLGHAERKNGWQLAEALGEPGPQGVQRLLNAADWEAEAVRDDLRAYVVEQLGDAETGVLVVDETGFLKKGTKSAGVGRQYSGTAGRIENCQIGVFLLYASARGAAFIDRALYLPESWVTDAPRRAEAGIPQEVGFATKGELAGALLARAFAAGVPAAWVVGDTIYGGDDLRGWLEGQGRPYVLAVASTHGIWTQGQPETVEALAAQLPAAAWRRLSAGAGSQGPRLYDWACLQLPYEAPEGMAHWLLVRRSLAEPGTGLARATRPAKRAPRAKRAKRGVRGRGRPAKAGPEYAYYRAYGPAATPVEELVRVAGRRWTIEEGFEQAKGEVGLDHYEVRRYDAWYRHVTLALVAHAALEVTRAAAAGAAAEGGEARQHAAR